MKADPKVLKALARIEGQVRGVARMVTEERYCIEVVTQIQAARAALARVEADLLRTHIAHCVSRAMQSPESNQKQRAIDELITVFEQRR